jgi:hypothetical protein
MKFTRAEGPNIYMYRRGEYTKNPLRNTIIERPIAHLIKLSSTKEIKNWGAFSKCNKETTVLNKFI